ncbi:sensor histidine kinase [Azonexus sp. IMCC34842]|uniref:sensor histidine kinase n=1 Tax=Azonexus sp. IMCC34842 TaxID=3420950 RepID=UPI003D0F2FB6
MSTTTDPSILGRQVELLYRNLRPGQVVALLNASLLSWVAASQLPRMVLGTWWLLAMLAAAWRISLAIRFSRRTTDQQHAQSTFWRRQALVGAAASGLVWAAGAILLMRFGDTTLQLFTALVMAGMVAGAVPILAADQRIFRAYAWPVGLAVLIGTIDSDPLHIAFSAMAVIYMVMLTRSADYFHDTLQDSLRLEHEKDGLVANLEHAREIAEQSNRAKTEFLANISHELRTPLNGVVGLGELLSHENLTPEQHELLVPLRHSADDLMRIISHLIELSALEAGHARPMPSPFPAGQTLIDTLLVSHRAAAEARGLALIKEIDPALPGVLVGDVERLRQIFTHLIGNAIKFTERGRVSVSARIHEHAATAIKVEFCIDDTGPGIPPEKLKLLSGLLVQADGSSVRRHGGIGVGLPIARKLIELLGGELQITSTAGVGSRFSFTLPFALVAVEQH